MSDLIDLGYGTLLEMHLKDLMDLSRLWQLGLETPRVSHEARASAEQAVATGRDPLTACVANAAFEGKNRPLRCSRRYRPHSCRDQC